MFSSGNGKTTAEGSVLGLLVNGPLFGGLYMFFLKKIRGEATTRPHIRALPKLAPMPAEWTCRKLSRSRCRVSLSSTI
jgi:hypothetical protein